MLTGFQWCVLADKSPVLVWQLSTAAGYAFKQKGDGSVDVFYTPLYAQQGAEMLAVPENKVQVINEMLEWACCIMGQNGEVSMGFASGMVNSGVGPVGYHDAKPRLPGQSKSIDSSPKSKSKTILGQGSWTI